MTALSLPRPTIRGKLRVTLTCAVHYFVFSKRGRKITFELRSQTGPVAVLNKERKVISIQLSSRDLQHRIGVDIYNAKTAFFQNTIDTKVVGACKGRSRQTPENGVEMWGRHKTASTS